VFDLQLGIGFLDEERSCWFPVKPLHIPDHSDCKYGSIHADGTLLIDEAKRLAQSIYGGDMPTVCEFEALAR
jgi:hypothetical protein